MQQRREIGLGGNLVRVVRGELALHAFQRLPEQGFHLA
jgi:hypothetical protein